MDIVGEYGNIADKLRLKIAFVVSINFFARFLPLYLFAYGAGILACKALQIPVELPVYEYYIPVGLIAAIFFISCILGFREAPEKSKVIAILDINTCSGGLVTASSELDIGSWKDRVPLPKTPGIKWDYRKSSFPLIMAIVFFAAAILIPEKALLASKPPIDVTQEVTDMYEKLGVLDEEDIIDEQLVQEYQKDISNMEKRANSGDSVGLWEAMDHLNNDFEKTAEKAADDLLNQIAESAIGQQLANSLGANMDSLDPGTTKEAMDQLAKLAGNSVSAEALKESKITPEQMKELLKKLQESQCDAGDLSQLSKVLGNCKACGSAKMGRLINGKLIDAKFLGKCEGAGKLGKEALAAYLAMCEGFGDIDIDALVPMGMPGRGGVTRGRGDAPMTWTDPTNSDNMAFKEQVLPPGAVSSLDNSEMQGVSIGDPTSEDPIGPSGSGALNNANSTGGSALGHRVLPTHRKVVRNYFDRNKDN